MTFLGSEVKGAESAVELTLLIGAFDVVEVEARGILFTYGSTYLL